MADLDETLDLKFENERDSFSSGEIGHVNYRPKKIDGMPLIHAHAQRSENVSSMFKELVRVCLCENCSRIGLDRHLSVRSRE